MKIDFLDKLKTNIQSKLPPIGRAPAQSGQSQTPASTTSPTKTVGVSSDTSVQDIIAPSAIEVDFDELKINNRYTRT